MAAAWDHTAVLRVQLIAVNMTKGSPPRPDTLNPFRVQAAKEARQQAHAASMAEMKASLPRASQKVPPELLKQILGG